MPSDGARWRVLTVLALLLAALGLAAACDGPFDRGWLGHNGARYAQIARNHARLGLTHLHGAPLLDAGVPDPVRPQVYAHHPPALAMVIALVFRVAGESENAARAVPVLATLLLLLLFARLVASVAGPAAGALAALAAVAQPMLSVYGSHVDVQGTPVLAFSVAALLLYRRWLLGRSALPLLACIAVGSAFDWYALYTPVVCAAHLAWTQPRRRAAAAGLAAWAAGLFALWLTWLGSLPGVTLREVFGAAGVRGAGALAGGDGRLGPAVSAWFSSTLDLMPGWPGLLLITVVVAWRARPADTRMAAAAPLGVTGLLLLLLVPPLTHALLFPAGLLVHAYWLFALPLPLAAATGVLLAQLRPVLALGLAALLLLSGVPAAQRVLAVRDPLPALVGQALGAHTASGDVVLTNYAVNPLVAGTAEDRYVLLLPEVTWYADRVVRGGLRTPADLADARARRLDAAWVLLTPWPPPDPALQAAVAAEAVEAPRLLQNDPPVRLYRLAR